MPTGKQINQLHKVKFYDGLKGGIIAEDQLFLTSDGGINWYNDTLKFKFPIDSINNFYFEDLHFPENNVIILAVDADTKFVTNFKFYLAISSDFGKTWTFSAPYPKQSEEIVFINKDKGWLGGRKGNGTGTYSDIITYTSDGGKSWKIQLDTITKGNGLHQLYFLDSMNGIAQDYWQVFWRTRDGGKHWNIDSNYNYQLIDDPFYDIAFIDTNLIIGATEGSSKIYKYSSKPDAVIEEPAISANISPTYPNPAPAGKEINLDIELTEPCAVTIETYNSLGIRTAESFSAYMEIGKHKFSLNSAELPSGAYFIKLTFNGKNSEVRKAVVW